MVSACPQVELNGLQVEDSNRTSVEFEMETHSYYFVVNATASHTAMIDITNIITRPGVGLILSFNPKGSLMVILAGNTPQPVAVIGDVWHHGNIISMTSQLSDLSECL